MGRCPRRVFSDRGRKRTEVRGRQGGDGVSDISVAPAKTSRREGKTPGDSPQPVTAVTGRCETSSRAPPPSGGDGAIDHGP
ncbi:unnamed protein product [Lota lota]